jgi:hypothetical protein
LVVSAEAKLRSRQVAHQATLRLLHLFLASHLFLEAVFEKAGDYFSRGKIDPRLVVRLYTTFRGKVLGSAEEVEVYEGLKEIFSEMPTLDGASEWSESDHTIADKGLCSR